MQNLILLLFFKYNFKFIFLINLNSNYNFIDFEKLKNLIQNIFLNLTGHQRYSKIHSMKFELNKKNGLRKKSQ